MKNRDSVAWKEQFLLVPFMLVGIGVGLLLLHAMPVCWSKCSEALLSPMPSTSSCPCLPWGLALGDPVWLSRRIRRDLVWDGWTLRQVCLAQRSR